LSRPRHRIPGSPRDRAASRRAPRRHLPEITLKGTDLDEARELHFSHAGLKAVNVGGQKFKLTIDASVPQGIHEVRASGRYGISTSAVFVTGALPEMNDPGNNHARSTAAALTLPVTVNGVTDAAADFYRFTAAKGQTLRADCAAQRIDSPLNATLSLRDASGNEYVRAEETLDRDPAFTFTAPADGAVAAGAGAARRRPRQCGAQPGRR
jgi:hypothetical protein